MAAGVPRRMPISRVTTRIESGLSNFSWYSRGVAIVGPAAAEEANAIAARTATGATTDRRRTTAMFVKAGFDGTLLFRRRQAGCDQRCRNGRGIVAEADAEIACSVERVADHWHDLDSPHDFSERNVLNAGRRERHHHAVLALLERPHRRGAEAQRHQ